MQKSHTIIEVIRFRTKNFTYNQIRSRFHVGNSTITLIMKRFGESGKTLDELVSMDPAEVEQLFYPPENRVDETRPMPDFEKIHHDMQTKDHQDTLYYHWIVYKKANPTGLQQTAFYDHYKKWHAQVYGPEVSMGVERIPGERLYIDWAGDKAHIYVNQITGEINDLHLFVTTLAYGNKVYAEYFINEKIHNFILGIIHAIEYYGAVPLYFVPDNLKQAVTKHTSDELVLNSLFADLEAYYGVVVLPPPSRKPRGKATVESGVRFVETHIIGAMSGNYYYSLEDANKEVLRLLDEVWEDDPKLSGINERPFQKRGGSRNSIFEKYDKPVMRPLPKDPFVIVDYKWCKSVPNNYHIEYDNHYYSVPYRYFGHSVTLKATHDSIVICDENNKLIAKHKRAVSEFPKYITESSHMPVSHQIEATVNTKDGTYYRNWASAIGPKTRTLIDKVLANAKHEQQTYRSCAGILFTCKEVPDQWVEEAAEECIASGICGYTYFKKMLNQVQKKHTSKTGSKGSMPKYNPNIRGDYS